MEQNNEQIVDNKKVHGLNIAAMVLGIVSLVLWCFWFISIPCAILALIFGIIGIKKQGKGMAISGIVIGAITIAIWVAVFGTAFIFGFMQGISEYDYTTSSYSTYY